MSDNSVGMYVFGILVNIAFGGLFYWDGYYFGMIVSLTIISAVCMVGALHMQKA